MNLVAIPRNAIRDLSPAELRALVVITANADDIGRCAATEEQLAADLGQKSRGSIAQQIRRLMLFGYVDRRSDGRLHLPWWEDTLRGSAAQGARISRAAENVRGSAAHGARKGRARRAAEPRTTPPLTRGGTGAAQDAPPPPCIRDCGRAAEFGRTTCASCSPPPLPAGYRAMRDARHAIGA